MSLFILLYLIILQNFSVRGQYKLTIDHISKFPISASKSFEIGFISEGPEGKIIEKVTDMMIIQITESDGSMLERAIFDYGFKTMIDQEFKGQYMRIPIWQLDLNQQTAMNASIIFTRLAHNKMLEIYTMSPNPTDRRSRLSSLQSDNRVLETEIQLLIPPKINMSIQTQDGRKGELMLDQLGIATCRAYDGVPNKKPNWVNLNDFKVKEEEFQQDRNERVAKILVKVLDHLKVLKCRAGATVESVQINVLHQPSQILLEPDVGLTVENGSTLLCSPVDGYPVPEIRWHLVKGPPNESRFYNISKDGKKLHIKSETPQNSQWIFNCTATNTLPSYSGIYNRTVAFSVSRQPEGLLRLHLTLEIMIGVAVMGAIIVFCVVIVFIVCIVRRSCAGHSDQRNHRRNGGPIKTAAEKKTLEAEQVTLLPPGAPPNHLDMSNNGSSLPSCPPEYQLIIDNEIKSAIPLDQQVVNETYPEVTYAELNTSYLPMKENKCLKANNNDDQVIYSQIIGTMSTPVDCGQRGYMDSDNV